MSATTTPATSEHSEGHAERALALLDDTLEPLWMAEPGGVADDADYRHWARQVAVALDTAGVSGVKATCVAEYADRLHQVVVSRLPDNRKDWEDWACGVLLQADMRARAAEYAGHATVEEAHCSPMPPPTAPVAPPPEPGHAPVVPRPKVSSTARQVLAHVEIPPRALSATSTAIITASSRKRGRTLSAAATGQDPLVLNDELDKLEEVSALAHATRFAVHSRSSSAVRPAKKVKKVSNLPTAPEPQLLTNWVQYPRCARCNSKERICVLPGSPAQSCHRCSNSHKACLVQDTNASYAKWYDSQGYPRAVTITNKAGQVVSANFLEPSSQANSNPAGFTGKGKGRALKVHAVGSSAGTPTGAPTGGSAYLRGAALDSARVELSMLRLRRTALDAQISKVEQYVHDLHNEQGRLSLPFLEDDE
ncbi:hypothetical protein VTO73DRAFT_13904 [Trametes versicolor]